MVSRVPLQCPIDSSLRVLGRKWALLVLRDIGFNASIENGGIAGAPKMRSRTVPVKFSQILRGNPGMSPRVLCIRLRELEQEGLIERSEHSPDQPRMTGYQLTGKGRDAIPILTALIQFGAHHYPNLVFNDGRARDLSDLFPDQQRFMLGGLLDYAAEASTRRKEFSRPASGS